MKNKLKKITYSGVATLTMLLIATTPVFAQSDPTAEINAIVERIITIATQVGSGILILFIVKDAFDLMQNKDNPMVRNMLARDVFLLIVAAIFLFRPDFILNAIRFIANA
jgi:Na+-driven multidrug efflux pump